MSAKRGVWLAAYLIILLGLSGVASARARARAAVKRVVVMGVAGGPLVEKDLVRFLRGGAQVLGQREYVRVATRLNATGTEPEDVVKVASRLRVALIVAGKLEKETQGYTLQLVLRDGAS